MISWKNALGLGAFALFVASMTPACASAPGDDGATGDQSADELSRTCGGIANIQCPGGYRCDVTDTHPDAAGVCRKECGGFAGIQCRTGYTCDLDSNQPDAMGVCRKTVADAGAPDADAGKANWFSCNKDSDCEAVPRAACCHNGWMEAVNKNHVNEYESSVTCQKPQICPMYVILDTRQAECNVGTHTCEMVAIDQIACGGFTMNPHKCPTGYNCQSNNIPDAPGTCVKQGCVQNVMCTMLSHWDATQCACEPNPSCGGFAGTACPSGYSQCIDNPNDGCDPAHGGADCPGVCVK